MAVFHRAPWFLLRPRWLQRLRAQICPTSAVSSLFKFGNCGRALQGSMIDGRPSLRLATPCLDCGRRDYIFIVVADVRASVVDDVGDLLIPERFAERRHGALAIYHDRNRIDRGDQTRWHFSSVQRVSRDLPEDRGGDRAQAPLGLGGLDRSAFPGVLIGDRDSTGVLLDFRDGGVVAGEFAESPPRRLG